MISVENFYWILHELLLKECDLAAWYFYPFGTLDSVVKRESRPRNPRRLNHVLFYDQEPLYFDHFTPDYENEHYAHQHKSARLLANSEKSDFKKSLVEQRGMLDWYYFYHGFAALDWFRDSVYLTTDATIQKHFLFLNHITQGPRCYRISLLMRLNKLDLLSRGAVSFHTDQKQLRNEINSNQYWSDRERKFIADHCHELDFLPMILDIKNPHGDMSAHFGAHEYHMWQSSFLHVVTETIFFESRLHLTEKTFKPIVALRPFVLVAAPGSLAYLRSYGFRTFDQWIDESYDFISDPVQRLDAVAQEVRKICALSPRQLDRTICDMMPVLEHNKRHFFGEFRRILVDELVDNFDQCVRIWNNGRVDGRDLPLHPDLARVKQTLLG